MKNMRSDVFGYFDTDSNVPTHDPGIGGICPVCSKKLSTPVKTISLIPDKIRTRSYFFRVHARCWDETSEEDQGKIESSLIDCVCQNALLALEEALKKESE